MAKFMERVRARELRRNGKSIREIAKLVDVSKGTVSLWCSDIALTEDQIQFLALRHKSRAYIGRLHAAENRRQERLMRVKDYGEKGRAEVGNIDERDLFILGIGLYWAEGDKKHRETKFINSDPLMIKIWIEWLFRFANIGKEDLKLCVGINQIHRSRIEEVTDYWSKVTGLPKHQFNPPSFKKVINRKIYSNFHNHFGSLTIKVRKSTNLNYMILGMIDGVGYFEGKS